MANRCEFDMYIVGNRAALAEIAKAAAGYGIYDMNVFEQGHKDDNAVIELCGDCVWSVKSAFFFTDHDGLVNLISACGATAEIWSADPAMGFREHIIVTPEGVAVKELLKYLETEIDWSPTVTPYGDGWIPSGTDIAYFGGARSFESQLQAIDAWAGTAEATKLDQPFDIDAAKRARTSSPMAQDSERGIHR